MRGSLARAVIPVGSAVATIVWSRAASNIPSISPLKMISTCRWLSAVDGSATLSGAVVGGISVLVIGLTRVLSGPAPLGIGPAGGSAGGSRR